MKFPALVLIDIQQGFIEKAYYGGERNNPEAELNAGRLLKTWRQVGWPVFHIHHHSENPLSPLHKSKDGKKPHSAVEPSPEETVYLKTVHSGFIENPLEQDLKEKGIQKLVFAGITANHCVSTNVRMANNLGFHCTLVSDATAAFDQVDAEGLTIDAPTVHRVTLASLKGEFAELSTTDEIIEGINRGEFPMVNT